jgi:hypothetical protein
MSFPRPSTHPGFFAIFILLLALFGPSSWTSAQDKNGLSSKIRSARSAWQKESKRISDLLGKLRDRVPTCNLLDKDIEKLEADIRAAEKELADQLREMAEGKFCSQCLRSASQLEAQGEPFLYHVRRVSGTVVPASPEQIEKAKQEGAEKIGRIRNRLKQKQDEKERALSELRDAHHQLLVATAAYHREIYNERDLQIAHWSAEAGDWEKKLAAQQQHLDALAKSPEDPARDVQIRAAQAQLRSSLSATSAAESRARQTATAFNQTVRRDMDALAQKAETIPAGQPLIDGWFIARSIASHNITYVTGNVRRPQSSSAAQVLKSGSKPTDTSGQASEKSISDLLKGK